MREDRATGRREFEFVRATFFARTVFPLARAAVMIDSESGDLSVVENRESLDEIRRAARNPH